MDFRNMPASYLRTPEWLASLAARGYDLDSEEESSERSEPNSINYDQSFNNEKSGYISDENMLEEEEDLWDSYRQKEQYYKHFGLFGNPHIQEWTQPLPDIENIAIDDGFCTSGSKDEKIYLGTKGVGQGVAICARGTDSTREHCFLALIHLHHKTPKKALEAIMTQLEGCDKSTIQIFLVGGNLHSLDLQRQLLDLRDQYPIIAAKFNILGDIDDEDITLSVAISNEGVYYGNRDLFRSEDS